MILKVFTQPNCPNCLAAKTLADQCQKNADWGKVEVYDVTTVDGLAEASFYTVMATPTVLLCDSQGKIIRDWRGKAPGLDELKKHLSE